MESFRTEGAWRCVLLSSTVQNTMTSENSLPPGFQNMLEFGLIEALMGRRARRFFMGAEIPDGVLAYKSRHKPVPLSELEKLLVVTACGGNTGWHHMIYRAKRYAPHLSNYSAAAGGRSFPSAAGFHTSNTFFTDDKGVYLLDNPIFAFLRAWVVAFFQNGMFVLCPSGETLSSMKRSSWL